jgi:hypothetical protein
MMIKLEKDYEEKFSGLPAELSWCLPGGVRRFNRTVRVSDDSAKIEHSFHKYKFRVLPIT